MQVIHLMKSADNCFVHVVLLMTHCFHLFIKCISVHTMKSFVEKISLHSVSVVCAFVFLFEHVCLSVSLFHVCLSVSVCNMFLVCVCNVPFSVCVCVCVCVCVSLSPHINVFICWLRILSCTFINISFLTVFFVFVLFLSAIIYWNNFFFSLESDKLSRTLPSPSISISNSNVELEEQVSDLRKDVEEYRQIIELQDQVLRVSKA